MNENAKRLPQRERLRSRTPWRSDLRTEAHRNLINAIFLMMHLMPDVEEFLLYRCDPALITDDMYPYVRMFVAEARTRVVTLCMNAKIAEGSPEMSGDPVIEVLRVRVLTDHTADLILEG